MNTNAHMQAKKYLEDYQKNKSGIYPLQCIDMLRLEFGLNQVEARVVVTEHIQDVTLEYVRNNAERKCL